MLRLCGERSRSYPGRSVRHAVLWCVILRSGEITGRGDRLSSPGDIMRVSRLISRYETKRSAYKIGKYDASESSALWGNS